ncbi:hypothetical protein [Cupriavidus sp. TMH.W2]|uniref:hypothetical protein n=1 Tax=Cupriavidus sp. TMH.W2 TaxID=3434465 RepID=UPI003D77B85E
MGAFAASADNCRTWLTSCSFRCCTTNGKQTDANVLQAYSAVNRQSGQFRSLIRFVAPARDVNKLMLKTGNGISEASDIHE